MEPLSGGWFKTSNSRRDYLWSAEQGAIAHRSSVHLDGKEHPIQVLSSSGLWIQLGSSTAGVIAGSTKLGTMFRRAGIGRVRKNLSTPLEPPAERVWIQSISRDPVLVLRREDGLDHAAFFRLRQISDGVRNLASTFGRIQVSFVVADDFLPDASWTYYHHLVAEYRAFGALVACIE